MTRIERQETDVRVCQVCHADSKNYILNSVPFHASEEHQQMANLSVGEIDTEDIVTAMAQGHLNWKSHCRKTMPCKKKKVGKKMVDMTSDLPLPPNPTICLTMHLSWEKGFTNMATVEQRVMGGLCWSSFCATGPLTPRWAKTKTFSRSGLSRAEPKGLKHEPSSLESLRLCSLGQ
ncbi:hypothetical protein PSTG_01280 [Puccinia striiformis f. sp. tritici PST-78]|uniref:Uncharacterized protein n=1 Tax=Puccinia striiformis f. sp. tritici PST-78 TaxID=1165861 RepID=A0A0L0W2K3_9BASI|nr:hypothetical protein PSTG_01280 [Puccinia striiformis f. sp. tritici PST-78]